MRGKTIKNKDIQLITGCTWTRQQRAVKSILCLWLQVMFKRNQEEDVLTKMYSLDLEMIKPVISSVFIEREELVL